MSTVELRDFKKPASVSSLPGVDVVEIPINIEAERALLGALLMNNDVFDRVSSFLKPDHFGEHVHARIFETASILISSGKLANPITLKNHFEYDTTLEEIGGFRYLTGLVSEATTVLNAAAYGEVVRDLALRRSLINLGKEIVDNAVIVAADEDNTPLKIIETAESSLYQLAEADKFGKGFQAFGRALIVAIDMAAAAYQRDGGLSGISSGLSDLDEKLGGLQASDLIILAGRPAMGKTALATNIAYHVAKAYKAEYQADGSNKVLQGGVVGFFSLEMSSEQLATRIIAEQSSISSEYIRRGKINEEEFERLAMVSRELQSLPLYIDDTGGLTIAQLAARARRLKRQRGLGLIVVDYLQLLAGSAKKASEGRVQEVTEITVGLKALAKELAVPIIALSQLSRQVESREDKRPQLSDLRESGSIEQDADVVLFVYREEYYLERLMPAEGTPEFQGWQEKMDRAHGRAEVIIGKQRHGPTGTVDLQFEGKLTRFSNLAKDGYVPERFE